VTTKTFDCVEMKRRGALKIYERLKDMTVDQKAEYWRKRGEAFRKEQEALGPIPQLASSRKRARGRNQKLEVGD